MEEHGAVRFPKPYKIVNTQAQQSKYENLQLHSITTAEGTKNMDDDDTTKLLNDGDTTKHLDDEDTTKLLDGGDTTKHLDDEDTKKLLDAGDKVEDSPV
jgi:hypothetical protein